MEHSQERIEEKKEAIKQTMTLEQFHRWMKLLWEKVGKTPEEQIEVILKEKE